MADPYLILLGPSGNVIATNDDGGDGEDAWIRDLRLPTSGTYTIEATAYRKRQLGKYHLRVDVRR
ncbi:MAG: hypothetical protein QF463_05330 [Vicinamibacterales bacterium]|nr:hypothetical protein [Acidobacteriota bacterium]MDP6373219.1 hypothetical protein [Vicinamibacterales bacterium]MDP6608469.1 hypothetical protein [Vicinamibacterales bacterium]HAK56279.1 hypothetical protein [Acidobacteriota bacterium]